MNIGKFVAPILGILLLFSVIMFWSSRGYGKVSPDAYEVSKALVGACQAKNCDRLAAVELLFAEDAQSPLEMSNAERDWLESMIDTAKRGDWKSAAKSARRMMDDQIEY